MDYEEDADGYFNPVVTPRVQRLAAHGASCICRIERLAPGLLCAHLHVPEDDEEAILMIVDPNDLREQWALLFSPDHYPLGETDSDFVPWWGRRYLDNSVLSRFGDMPMNTDYAGPVAPHATRKRLRQRRKREGIEGPLIAEMIRQFTLTTEFLEPELPAWISFFDCWPRLKRRAVAAFRQRLGLSDQAGSSELALATAQQLATIIGERDDEHFWELVPQVDELKLYGLKTTVGDDTLAAKLHLWNRWPSTIIGFRVRSTSWWNSHVFIVECQMDLEEKIFEIDERDYDGRRGKQLYNTVVVFAFAFQEGYVTHCITAEEPVIGNFEDRCEYAIDL
jgi:hypothetical protein